MHPHFTDGRWGPPKMTMTQTGSDRGGTSPHCHPRPHLLPGEGCTAILLPGAASRCCCPTSPPSSVPSSSWGSVERKRPLSTGQEAGGGGLGLGRGWAWGEAGPEANLPCRPQVPCGELRKAPCLQAVRPRESSRSVGTRRKGILPDVRDPRRSRAGPGVYSASPPGHGGAGQHWCGGQ